MPSDILSMKDINSKAISEGAVEDRTPFDKFGVNRTAPGSNALFNVWPGVDIGGLDIYPWLTAAMVLSIVSDSAQDSATGTGVKYVRVLGLDANGDVQTAVVILTGVTKVDLPGTWSRVFRIQSGLGGSGAAESYRNAGNIVVYHTANLAANIVAGIEKASTVPPIGSGQTEMAMFTVPKGLVFILEAINTDVDTNQTGEIILQYRQAVGDVFTHEAWGNRQNDVRPGSGYSVTYPTPLHFPELTDLAIFGYLQTGGAVSAQLIGYFALNGSITTFPSVLSEESPVGTVVGINK